MKNYDTLNVCQGLSIFLNITHNTKILANKGSIDIVLPLSISKLEVLRTLEFLGWEQLSDFSWRYWLENFNRYDTYNYSCVESSYYDSAYQIVEETLYDS